MHEIPDSAVEDLDTRALQIQFLIFSIKSPGSCGKACEFLFSVASTRSNVCETLQKSVFAILLFMCFIDSLPNIISAGPWYFCPCLLCCGLVCSNLMESQELRQILKLMNTLNLRWLNLYPCSHLLNMGILNTNFENLNKIL